MSSDNEVLWVVTKGKIAPGAGVHRYRPHLFRTRAAARMWINDNKKRFPNKYWFSISPVSWGPEQ